MRWVKFILSHSIFISFCAVAMCYQTFVLLNIVPARVTYFLVFFSTICSYNFYWLLSKYSFSRPKNLIAFFRRNVSYIVLALFSSLATLYCIYLDPKSTYYVVPAAVLTVMYSLPLWPFAWAISLRKAGIFKTALLAFTWAFVTVLIPAKDLPAAGNLAVILLFVTRFFFVGMLCAIFDKRDAHIDRMHGLHTLATDTPARALSLIMVASFFIYIAFGLWFRSSFSYDAQLIAFIITGLLTGWVFLLSQRPRGYVFYYFGVDGLMLFSASASWVASYF